MPIIRMQSRPPSVVRVTAIIFLSLALICWVLTPGGFNLTFSWKNFLYELSAVEYEPQGKFKQTPFEKSFSRKAPTFDRLCPNEALLYQGHWIHKPQKRRKHIQYIIQERAGLAEREFRTNQSNIDKVLPWNEWDWQPKNSSCKLYPFDNEEMCRTLVNLNFTSILIVGDSTSFMMVQSLNGLLKGEKDIDQLRNAAYSLCHEQVTLRFVRNDALYVDRNRLTSWHRNPEMHEDEKRGIDFNRSSPWTPYLDGVDLLILNTGAHIHNLNFYKNIIDEVVNYVRNHYKGYLVYRTTSPGHPRCWLYQGPIEEKNVRFKYEEEYQKVFTWHMIEDFNNYAAQEFQNIGANILRGDQITKDRPDGHRGRDCLHYFLPGPVDWWNKVLYSLFRDILATKEDRSINRGIS